MFTKSEEIGGFLDIERGLKWRSYIHTSDCLLLSYSQTFKVNFQSDGYHPIPTWFSYPWSLRIKWLNFQIITL